MCPHDDLATTEAVRDQPCEVLTHPTVAAPSTPCEGGGPGEVASFLRPEGVGIRRVRFQGWREPFKYAQELIELCLRSLVVVLAGEESIECREERTGVHIERNRTGEGGDQAAKLARELGSRQAPGMA